MKNLLKKLHMMPNNQTSDVDSEGSSSMGNQRLSDVSGWLNSVTNRPNVKIEDRNEGFDSMSSEALDAAMEAVRAGDSQVEEEYQIQLALELSAREDPEAVQIEAVKQISLGSFPPHNTPAQVLAYQYWNYSALSYDDKILNGFYDLYKEARCQIISHGKQLLSTRLWMQIYYNSNKVYWKLLLLLEHQNL